MLHPQPIFLILGLLNNLLYVIILSAAVDLHTSPGLTALFNIGPSLVTKLAVPYLISSRANYNRRIPLISICTSTGMLCVAFSANSTHSNSLLLRLLGIAITSLSSGGLGDITFLQLCSVYAHMNALAWYAAGTGLAGVVGSASWLGLRELGVHKALFVCSAAPLIQPLALRVLHSVQTKEEDSNTHDDDSPLSITITEKKNIAVDVFRPYMVPLFAVYLFEYTINQGVAPALIYPHNGVIDDNSRFYPTYQLIYQTGVFVSRSSHLLGFGKLSKSKLGWPSIAQGCILAILLLEAVYKILGFYAVASIILIEGLLGGLAYVNTFHHTNTDYADHPHHVREFAVGLVSLSDGVGIVVASLISIALVDVLSRS